MRINVDETFHNVVREIRRMNKEQEAGPNGYGPRRQNFDVEEGRESGSGCCGCVLM